MKKTMPASQKPTDCGSYPEEKPVKDILKTSKDLYYVYLVGGVLLFVWIIGSLISLNLLWFKFW